MKKGRRSVAIQPGKPFYGVLLVLCVISYVVVDYVTLPAYNLHSFSTWVLAAIYVGILGFIVGGLLDRPAVSSGGIVCGIVLFAVALCASATSWLVWPGNAGRYYAQLAVTERDASSFARDFPDLGVPAAETGKEVQAAAGLPAVRGETLLLPRTDKELSTVVAQGKLGNYGARFQMDGDIFTAIAVERNGATEVVRVSPLDYTGTMVALTGGSRGTAGYIEVNQTTEEGRLVTVSGGMKYTPGAVLGYDLDRHVRFRYRTLLFGAKSFEIDDEGHPFWVIPVIRNTIGLFGGPDRNGVVLVDPVTGGTTFCTPGNEPRWVDRCLPTDMVLTQANNRLRLKDGWINVLFGEKRDVFQLSDSYNYVVTSGPGGSRTWLVSGITSPSERDQTLVGFMMVNLRTKEARSYAMSGITEMRAMEIARNDERVRAQALAPTWPILVDVGGEGAYYLFLKNSVQRQRFVYIDLATGRKVAMGETIEGARSQFLQLLGSKAASSDGERKGTGTVIRVKESPGDGKILFLLAGESENLYSVDAELSNGVRFLAPGDRVELSWRELPASPGRRFVSGLKNLSLEKQGR